MGDGHKGERILRGKASLVVTFCLRQFLILRKGCWPHEVPRTADGKPRWEWGLETADSQKSVRKGEGWRAFGSPESVLQRAAGFGNAVSGPWSARGGSRTSWHVLRLRWKGVHRDSDLASAPESATTWLCIHSLNTYWLMTNLAPGTILDAGFNSRVVLGRSLNPWECQFLHPQHCRVGRLQGRSDPFQLSNMTQARMGVPSADGWAPYSRRWAGRRTR